MLEKGFDFLITRDAGEIVDFGDTIDFPPLYKLFCRTFKLGYEAIQCEKYIHETVAPLSASVGYFKFHYDKEDKDAFDMIVEFSEVSQILDEFDYSDHLEVPWVKYQLIRIAGLEFSGTGGLYVGVGQHNRDEIWRINTNAPEAKEYLKIASNIFEFVQLFEAEFDVPEIPDFFQKAEKKWGDEYWRIPEKKDESEKSGFFKKLGL